MMNYSTEMVRDQHMVQSVWPEWKLVKPLGSGQYGVVYKAHRQNFAGSSFAAVKVVTVAIDEPESNFSNEQKDSYLSSVARNYIREIKMMESVKGYSNIVNIEDYSVISNTGGRPWYILIRMELLTPLYEYLENRDITNEQIIHIGIDLCKALEVCASKKIVHRDIKPGNVFVNEEGVFKLGDFGTARQILNNTSQTKTGTPDYMAPEIYHGSLHTADFEKAQSADIYSLGMLMYWAANRKRLPFIEQNGLITADEISNAFIRKMSGEKLPAPVDASAALSKIILKACAYSLSDRYKSASQLEEALVNIQSVNHPEKQHKKSFMTVSAIIAALLICCVCIVFFARFISPSPTVSILPTGTPEESAVLFSESPSPSPTVSALPAGTPEESAVLFSEATSPSPTVSTLPTGKPEENAVLFSEAPSPSPTVSALPTGTPEENAVLFSESPSPSPTVSALPTDTPVPVSVSQSAPDAARSDSVQPWPVMDLTGIPAQLKPLGQGERHQSFIGPDRQKYPEAGGFKPAQVSSASILFQEGDYILTDISYPSSRIRRCVYFPSSALSVKMDDTVCFISHAVKLTKDAQPRLGPGDQYDKWELPVLKSGTEVNVLLESGDWIFTEYSNADHLIRAWLPADSIR